LSSPENDEDQQGKNIASKAISTLPTKFGHTNYVRFGETTDKIRLAIVVSIM
jgi:hypothetical protein